MSTHAQYQPPQLSLVITFAHYLEAAAFIEQEKMIPLHHWSWGKVFQSEFHPYCWVLITGEGPWKAFAQTTKLLSEITALQGQVFNGEVFNVGIAGSLRPSDTDHLKTVSIRTAYARVLGELQFHSSTSSKPGLVPFDCITSQERILSSAARDELAPFASIVDRELWGIAQACQLASMKIPWSATKLISDDALEQSCELVMAKHRELSEQLATIAQQHLYQFVSQTPISNTDSHIRQDLDSFIGQLKIDAKLHLTFHQRQALQRRIKQLLLFYSLDRAEILFEQLHFKQWQEQLPEHLSPKMRAKYLLAWLERLAYPDLPNDIFATLLHRQGAAHD